MYDRHLRCDGNALDTLVDKGSCGNCLGLAHISASKRHQKERQSFCLTIEKASRYKKMKHVNLSSKRT